MSPNKKNNHGGTMLDLWRPPHGAGDPVGCIATTYTFSPMLFEEECLARFLGIGTSASHEGLAFLLERETRLGSIYAGVLVDHTEAGVEHSLRWDVLPVRLPLGKQHAKIALLSWARFIRIIITSSNLTDPGYRTNYEVAGTLDMQPDDCDRDLVIQATAFLRSLIRFVPASSVSPPNVVRANAFLDLVGRQITGWTTRRRKSQLHRSIAFSLPRGKEGQQQRSALDEALQACSRRGGSPTRIRIASPFFDMQDESGKLVAHLCKRMAKGDGRELSFSVPAYRDGTVASKPRIAAPKAIWQIPPKYNTRVSIDLLPVLDADKNPRQWHAKMIAFSADHYYALMVGSSNFTNAGFGITPHRNAEANLITIAERYLYGRESRELESVWPGTEPLTEPDNAEWLGAQPEMEDDNSIRPQLPQGFLSAIYSIGEHPIINIGVAPENLPSEWSIFAVSTENRQIIDYFQWQQLSKPAIIEADWPYPYPPDKILVKWEDKEAFLTVNVEDPKQLPPPPEVKDLSADELLMILAASDPSAAFRILARKRQPNGAGSIRDDIDSEVPIDLDPLRRFDLQATFLHRIRHRARILARMRLNLQKPVLSLASLEWKLKGLVGISALADRLVSELEKPDPKSHQSSHEALLNLADFLIVLNDVDYSSAEGYLSKQDFNKVFRPFLRDLVDQLDHSIDNFKNHAPEEMRNFWKRVVEHCRK